VDQYVDEVMPAAIQAKELAIQHMRNPGYGKPVGGISRGKRPLETLSCNAVADVGSIAGVGGIVEVYEIEMQHLGIDCERG
jgi:hypothetical protein